MTFSASFLKGSTAPPRPDEVEISLFGAGVGECILLHVADGDWVIIDSCTFQSKTPVCLEYLRAIGVDVARQVRLVIITHWHDDHIRGASAVFRECKSAELVCSGALLGREFLRLVEIQKGHKPILDAISTGVDEFGELMQLVRARKEAEGRLPIQWASSSKVVFQRASQPSPVVVTALSPSDAEFQRALVGFSKITTVEEGEAKRRVPLVEPNDTAVALWVQVNRFNLLLGSDLETGESVDRGWQHIVGSSTRPPGRAIVFKVPHHGSVTGYHEPVWGEMLSERPVAILTPYTRSGLPRDEEIRRILGHTCNAYSAASRTPKKIRRETSVDKVLKSAVTHHRVLDGRGGLVRLRFGANKADITPELFGAACHLSDELSDVA